MTHRERRGRPSQALGTVSSMSFRRLSAAILLCLLVAGCGEGTADTPEPTPSTQSTDTPTAAGTPTAADTPTAAGPTGPTAATETTAAATETAGEPAQTAPAATPASCQKPQAVPVQGGEHLIGDNSPPVPYNSTPPTSGWHASGAFEVMVQPIDQPLSEPRQVSVLEAGGAVVTHGDLDEGARTALEQHVTANHSGRVAVTGYEPLSDGEVVFASWGLLQRCQGVDLAALDAFVTANADAEVTTGHDH